MPLVAISLDQVAMPRPPRDRFCLFSSTSWPAEGRPPLRRNVSPGASALCGHEFTKHTQSGLLGPFIPGSNKTCGLNFSSPCSADDDSFLCTWYLASPCVPESAAG